MAALARQGVLERDPVVLRALQGARQRLDERSIQRHFAEVAGLGLKTLQQIARAHQAAELLRRGGPRRRSLPSSASPIRRT